MAALAVWKSGVVDVVRPSCPSGRGPRAPRARPGAGRADGDRRRRGGLVKGNDKKTQATKLRHQVERSAIGAALLPFADRGRTTFKATLWANFAANIVRNVWSHSIIFCGHFPDQTYTFTQEEVEDEIARRLVRPPAPRRGEHRRQRAVPRDLGEPRLPGRAPPVPGHALARATARSPRACARCASSTACPTTPARSASSSAGAPDDPAAGLPRREAADEAGRLRRAAAARVGRGRAVEPGDARGADGGGVDAAAEGAALRRAPCRPR